MLYIIILILVIGILIYNLTKNYEYLTPLPPPSLSVSETPNVPLSESTIIGNISNIYNAGNLQIPQVNATNLNILGTFNLFPKGLITIINSTTIPNGWAICDGTNGTPDLRDRFILGTSSEYTLGSTGGSPNSILTINNLPTHSHDQNGAFKLLPLEIGEPQYSDYWSGVQTVSTGTVNLTNYGPHFSGPFTSSSETNVDNSKFGGNSFSIMPPFITMIYIMKL